MELKDLKRELLEDKKFSEEYFRYDLAFEIGEMVIDARVKLGLTQEALAQMTSTKQPSIARLENGTKLPSLSFLEKIAKAMGTYLIAPRFAFLDNETVPNEAENSYAPITSAWRITLNDYLVGAPFTVHPLGESKIYDNSLNTE